MLDLAKGTVERYAGFPEGLAKGDGPSEPSWTHHMTCPSDIIAATLSYDCFHLRDRLTSFLRLVAPCDFVTTSSPCMCRPPPIQPVPHPTTAMPLAKPPLAADTMT